MVFNVFSDDLDHERAGVLECDARLPSGCCDDLPQHGAHLPVRRVQQHSWTEGEHSTQSERFKMKKETIDN